MNYFRRYIRELLREAVVREISQLKDYLTQSDKDKAIEVAYSFDHNIEDYLRREGKYGDLVDQLEEGKIESYEVIEKLEEEDPGIIHKYGEWMMEDPEERMGVMPAELPTWVYIEYRGLVTNQWLIHFTDNSLGVAREGFTIGVEDVSTLGLTTQLSNIGAGYNFAFLLSDYVKHGKGSRYAIGTKEWKYGNEAVIFRASGINVWHYSDEESQVIFWGPSAKDIIPMRRGESLDWGIYSNKTGNLLYESDYLEEVVNWLIKNFDQYRKHIL